MNTHLIDGNAIARELRDALRTRIAALADRGVQPGLAVVLVGDNPASKVYVRNKLIACESLGMRSFHIELAASTRESELLEHIGALNANDAVHGILVQLPLPPGIPERRVIEALAPEKDVDGFHPSNLGYLAVGRPRFVPCTPAGVMRMLEREGVDPAGRHAVIVGRSNIVGKPMALLLLQKNATVTICHSKTPDLGALTRQADLLVVAAGRPKLVRGDMVKRGAVVVDVGINRGADGKLCGDVDIASVLGVAARVTPVPGGVGPLTIAMLLENCVLAAERAAARSR